MRDDPRVRTTLDLDDDVLQASKDLAEFHGVTAGKMLSELARRGLVPSGPVPKVRNGVPLLPSRGRIMTMKEVNELRDEDA
jgi:hypothetical protein